MASAQEAIDVPEMLRVNIAMLRQSLQEKMREREKIENKCIEMELNVLTLEKEKAYLDIKELDLERKIFDLQTEINTLTEESKEKNKYKVQLFSKHGGELMTAFLKDLENAIRAQNNKDTGYEVIHCLKESHIQSDVPRLLTCFGASVSQSIRNALKGIPVTEKTAVVIVHLKAEHALPLQPTDRTISVNDFGPLGGIYDIGYTKDKGMYRCRMNENNLISIINFITRNCKTSTI